MPKKIKRATPVEFVPHPRYGALPMCSGLVIDANLIASGHWRCQAGSIFPESVLIADLSRQDYAVYPRKYYVDESRVCRDCGRHFLFFAREQRHWFETLVFFVDADCVHCPPCRKARHRVARRMRGYEALSKVAQPSDKQLMCLIDDVIFLMQRGVLRDLDKLGRLKKWHSAPFRSMSRWRCWPKHSDGRASLVNQLLPCVTWQSR